MKAIIPVAGHGTRLEPYTLTCQKCLLPVAGKPVLEHILDRLLDANVYDMTLIIGHLGEQVIDFCKGYSKVNFTFINQEERKGLGHAIFQGLQDTNEAVLIVLGDAILNFDYVSLVSSQNSVLGVHRVPDPERFGIVEMNNDRIINIIEKPEDPLSDLALIGIYLISSEKDLLKAIKYLFNNQIKTKNEYQLTDALQYMIQKGHFFKILEIDECLDCGIKDTLLSTNQILLERKNCNFIDSSAIINNSEIINSNISQNAIVMNSSLNNVIALPGSRIVNQKLQNAIVGFDEIIE